MFATIDSGVMPKEQRPKVSKTAISLTLSDDNIEWLREFGKTEPYTPSISLLVDRAISEMRSRNAPAERPKR